LKKKILSVVLLTVSLLFLCSSCLSTGKDAPFTGEGEGITYLYLEEQNLLIFSGEGPLLKENRICSLDFFKEAEYIYLSKGITELGEGVLASEKVKGVYCQGTPEILDSSLSKDLFLFEVKDFEDRTDLPFGVIGHCPSATEDLCLLCGITCYYEYVNHRPRFLIKGNPVTDNEFVTEGQSRKLDAEGFMDLDSFVFLGGSTRYFKDGKMITGEADIEDVRYKFSSDGSLYSARPIDHSVSPVHVLCILSAIPLGALLSFGVYLIYKKKNNS
jgi:hypothetical protein